MSATPEHISMLYRMPEHRVAHLVQSLFPKMQPIIKDSTNTNSLLIFGKFQMSRCWCSLVCSIVHPKFFDDVSGILALRYKDGVFHLFNLKTKKVSQFPNKTHFKL
ncbi:hypothetical protein QL285_051390 [Trifolium repens]|nr:hypothetical protein QL285_051390 [Trifolium repens]